MTSRIFLLLPCLFSLAAVAYADNTDGWEHSVDSEKKLFRGKLLCETPPTAGTFQSCLLELADQRGNPARKANIKISGGMPIHRHGFPTSPEVIPGDKPGTYLIKGLKYSMSGEWVIDMKIHVYNLVDQLTYELNVTY